MPYRSGQSSLGSRCPFGHNGMQTFSLSTRYMRIIFGFFKAMQRVFLNRKI